MAVVHRSLDGSRFRFSGGFDLGAPSTSVQDVTIGGRLQEFTAGPLGLGREVRATLGRGGFDEELGFAGGTLSIARNRAYDARGRLVEDTLAAVWEGRRFSLVTHWYGADPDELVGVFRALTITEHTDGLTVDPAPGVERAAPATVIKQVPTVGLVELAPLTREHLATLPRWRGQAVAGGELFQDTLSNGDPFYVLAGADTWATVIPLGDSPSAALAERLGRLRVELVG